MSAVSDIPGNNVPRVWVDTRQGRVRPVTLCPSIAAIVLLGQANFLLLPLCLTLTSPPKSLPPRHPISN